MSAVSAPRWEPHNDGDVNTLTLPDLVLVVAKHPILAGSWYLTCREASFDRRDLGTDSLAEAKVHALRLVRDRLTKIADYARHACEWQEHQ